MFVLSRCPRGRASQGRRTTTRKERSNPNPPPPPRRRSALCRAAITALWCNSNPFGVIFIMVESPALCLLTCATNCCAAAAAAGGGGSLVALPPDLNSNLTDSTAQTMRRATLTLTRRGGNSFICRQNYGRLLDS